MTDSFWQNQLAGLEPTTFPDLTGKSLSTRSKLTEVHSSERHLNANEDVNSNIAPAVFLATCAKILALYTAEHDLCIAYLSPSRNSAQGSHTPCPVRLAFHNATDNREITANIQTVLDGICKNGAPSPTVIYNVFESPDVQLSDVLVVLRDDSNANHNLTSRYYDKYRVIFEFVAFSAPDAKQAYKVKVHFRSSVLNFNDTPHVLDALQQALNLILERPRSDFVSWGTDLQLTKSVLNSNPEAADCYDRSTIHALFERHVSERPNDIALDFLEEDFSRTQWTFLTLNSFANEIATRLINDYHVRIEDSIPLCVAKSPLFYACVLGVLKAGANFTPFTGSPPERQQFMCEELGAKVIMVARGQNIPWASSVTVFDVTSIFEPQAHSSNTNDLPSVPRLLASNLCYQMYTSGSTGRPKAVSLEHGHAVQTACATRELIPWTTESRILQQAGVTFDMCYFETFFAWSSGICLCSAPDKLIYNKLTETINDMKVTLLGLTPSVALTLDPEQLPDVAWMYCIGEALPQSLVDAWEGRLVNSYGPTEAAQMVTLFPVKKDIKSTVIGKPFRNTSFTILHRHSTEVIPILGIGELCIGGYQIARGYHRNPDKTKQSFIELGNERLYRTGDLVRMLGNETVEFIGRVDDQIKIRGHRVELGEIDKTVKRAHQSIERVSTQILKVNDQGKAQLAVFVVLSTKVKDLNQQAVRNAINLHLANSLPAYMVPKFVLFIREMPLSLAGKVDKRILTRILRDSEQVRESTTLLEAKTCQGTTRMLQEIYGSACGVSPNEVGLDVSIYQLGIDSISAIQISRKLRKRGIKIEASDVMNHPTISSLSKVILNGIKDPQNEVLDQPILNFAQFDKDHRTELEKRYNLCTTKVASIRPASPFQASMIVQSTQSSGPLYFNHLCYRMPNGVNWERLFAAWNALISVHEILRSGFAPIENIDHPVAMITYHAKSLPAPVQKDTDGGEELEAWRSQFMNAATTDMFLPPWQVRVTSNLDKFYFSAHHALYDAQVLEILMRDLAAAYDGLQVPSQSAFEPQLSRILAMATETDSRIQFWKEQGRKAMASKFPILHPLIVDSGKLQSASGSSSYSMSDLNEGCKNSGMTMQSAAQVAWGYLLGAFTGETIVTFGTVLSGRLAENSEEVSLPMIATVPTTVDCLAPSLDMIQKLMRFNADVQQNQFVPLNRIQYHMGQVGEALFDTIFTFQKRPVSAGPTNTRFIFQHNELTVEYPVSVELESTDSGELGFTIYYKPNYMLPEQASLIVDQFQFLLEHIIFQTMSKMKPRIEHADPNIFSVIHATDEFLTSEKTLMHHSVEFNAREIPGKFALEFVTSIKNSHIERRSWTFKELDEEGNRIAQLLRKKRVAQGSIVALCCEKSPEAAFAMIGISKAGCAFLALDPGAPMDRKKFIMEDSRASILLTKGRVANNLLTSLPDITIDLSAEEMSQYSTSPVQLDRDIDPQEMAYCLYTSGTTGTPKGCIVTHENVVQVFLCFEKLYAYTDDSRWLQFASYHFDVSVMEHFWSWSVGMTVVKASRDLVFQDLAHTISALQITHIDLTPSLARLLDPKDVPTLAKGVFVTGGEMLRRDIIEAWGPSGAIHNAYGPTEATIGVTMYRGVPQNGRPSNIGWPFRVVGVFVVQVSDPSTPVLRGGVGELLIAGKLVAKGYLRREELTAQRFIEVAGQRCYRTGDLARVLSDGSIEFLGRADDQVKLRGQRLETGEINSVMKQHDERIDDISTLVLRHPSQQKEQLVSFVSVRGNGSANYELSICTDNNTETLVSELLAACKNKLPGYMIPTHIILVNKLPLSANNKVDGKQLKALYEKTEMDAIHRLSSNRKSDHLSEAHQKQAQRITEVLSKSVKLDVTQIPASSNFFELGLDSISMISFARSLKAAGYKNASSSLIMKNSSIGSLATALTDTSIHSNGGPNQSAIRRISAFSHRYKGLVASLLNVSHEDIEIIMPCTALQAGMISRSLESKRGLYFAAFTYELKATAVLERLRGACERVCNQVQVLRTKFVPTDDGFIQVVLRKVHLPWVELKVDSEQKLESTSSRAYSSWVKKNSKEVFRPFELLAVKLPDRIMFTLHMFHALYDGNSLPLIMNAVLQEYVGSGRASYGPAFSEALPYGPLNETEGAQKFWTEQLSGLADLPVRALRSLSTDKQMHDTCVTHHIDPIVGFEKCRRNLNVTHQAMIQACWSVLLQNTMSEPLILGMIVSGRSVEFEAVDSVIGPMFNTIPFWLKWTKDDTWTDVVLRSHAFNIAALAYQHTPLRDIQKWTRQQRQTGTLFDTLFVFQKEKRHQSAPEAPWTAIDEKFEADYPLAFEVEHALDGGFNLTLACQAHFSDEGASSALLKRFENTLLSLVRNTEQPLFEAINSSFEFNLITNTLNQNSHTNGDKNGYVNGHSNDNKPANGNGSVCRAPSGNTKSSWSDTMKIVCKEVASLANVNIDEIRSDTSIFELGLDSIDAVKLSSRLKRATSIPTPVSQIVQLLTLDKISKAIDKTKGTIQEKSSAYDLPATSEAIEISLKDAGMNFDNIERVFPCTPLQEGMIADMLNSNFERYLNFDVLELRHDLDLEKLKSAWKAVVEAFPILRSLFVEVTDPMTDCTIAQAVKKSDLEFGNLMVSAEIDFPRIFLQLRADVKQRFDCQPPLRLTFIQDKEGTRPTHLVLTLAHAMYDGWSLGLIHDFVSRSYHGGSFEHSDYTPALTKILDSSGEVSQKFWRQHVADTTPTLFAVQRNGDRTVCRLERESQVSLTKVQSFCKQESVTVAALCQAAWSIVLAHHTQQLDVAFAQVLSGRIDETTNNVIFPTMNTVISRTVLHGNCSEIVRYIQDTLTKTSEHQHFPLRKALAMASSGSAQAMFNSLFIFQKSATDLVKDKQQLYESVESASNVEYPVCVEAEVAGNRLIWRTACESSYLDDSETKNLLEQLDTVLETIIQNPGQSVVELKGDEVCLCNLPAISIMSAPNSDAGSQLGDSNDSEGFQDWSVEEQLIREVVAEVAKLEQQEIRKQSNIFGLGLDSISTIKVSSLLRKRGFDISINDLLSAGSIQDIAKKGEVTDADQNPQSKESQRRNQAVFRASVSQLDLVHNIDTAHLLATNQIQLDNVERILPTTAGQVLFLSRWQNEGLYYSSLDFSTRGYASVDRLHSAWTQVVQRTSMLRTVFIGTDERECPIIQVTLKAATPIFEEVNSDSDLSQVANTRASEPASTPIPCALFIQRSGEAHFQLALKIQHALYDGFSLKMLIRKFEELLRQPDTLPTSTCETTFSDFLINTKYSESKRRFWTEYLADMKFRSLPLLNQEQNGQPPKHNHLVRANVLQQISFLQDFARRHLVSIQSLLIASYSINHAQALNKHYKDKDIKDVLIGIFMANRNLAGADELEAPTLGFSPLRVHSPLTRTIVEIAKQIQSDMREIAQDGRGQVGLWELQEWLGCPVKIDVWINILRQWLPDQAEEDAERIQVVTGEKSEDVRRQYDIRRNTEDPENGLFLKDSVVRGCYDYPMMDLEATVKDDNLDIGIQAPSTLVDFEKAEEIIRDVASRLEGLTK